MVHHVDEGTALVDEAALIVEQPDSGHPQRRPVRELVAELIEQLGPTATRLGTTGQLADVATILESGTGATRQRAVVDAGGTLVDVVHHLARELSDDRLES